ncbi:MAG TPA: type II CAAX endopeptidase family protein [Candidatus Limnocylindrales bacterium]
MTGPDSRQAEPGATVRLPGGSTFTIEGRAAPGLYLVGWLGSVMGLGVLAVAILSGASGLAGFALSLAGSGVLSVGLTAAAGAQTIERRARHVEGYDGPSPFLLFPATLALTIVLVLVVGTPAVALGLDVDSPLSSLLSVSLTALAYVTLVRLVVVGPGALDWRAMGLARPRAAALEDIALGALLALPLIVVTLVLTTALVALVGKVPDSPLPQARTGVDLAVNLLAAAVVAPVGEEIFFRGFATTAWLRTMGPERAILRGAVFFAVVHILTVGGSSFGDAAGRALVAFVGRLPYAFALGWLFVRRRSLYASIGFHAAFNGLLIVLGELASTSVGLT